MICPPWPWSLALSWETNSQAEIFNSLGFQFWGNVLSWPLVTENKMSHSLPQPKRQGGGETKTEPAVLQNPMCQTLSWSCFPSFDKIDWLDWLPNKIYMVPRFMEKSNSGGDRQTRKQIEATTAVWSTNTSELGQTCFFRIGKWSCLHCRFCLSAEAECS